MEALANLMGDAEEESLRSQWMGTSGCRGTEISGGGDAEKPKGREGGFNMEIGVNGEGGLTKISIQRRSEAARVG